MLLYIILGVSFVAIIMAFQMVIVPIREGIKRANERSEQIVSKDLDAMFVFIPTEYLTYIKVGAMVGMTIVFWFMAAGLAPPGNYITTILGAVAGYFAPEIVVMYLAQQRLKKFSEQLVDGLVMLSNGMRAGFTLQQAIELLVEESKPPISQEFALALRQYRLGMDLDEALLKVVERTKDRDLELAVTAVTITRQVGGNIAEIFDRIVAMIRDRKLLEGKTTALTAQGKLQALVVAAIPYVLGLVVAKINPAMMSLMWSTVPGWIALALVVILDTAGYFWVLKLTKIEY
jgi:tight adherence protein B